VDTDLQLPALLNADHTLVARFMMQFPIAGAGPIFSSQSGAGTFSVAKEDYDHNMPLAVTYGSKSAKFSFPTTFAVQTAPLLPPRTFNPTLDIAWREAVAGRWFHLAVVRSGSTVKVFLDGTRLMAVSGDTDTAGNLDVTGVVELPSGTSVLRLGQLADARRSTSAFFAQFYGLMDDVAAFNTAMSDSAVKHLAQHPHALSGETGLVGLYQFNYNPAAISDAVAHNVTFSGAAFQRHVSESGDNAKDAAKMLTPQHKTVFHLPFRRGLAFVVMWGNEIDSHTGGGSAFSWDFQRVGNNIDVQKESDGQPLAAVAAGRVVRAFDGGDATPSHAKKPLTDGYNVLLLEHSSGEQSLYMHVKTGSITEAFTHAGYLFSPVAPNNGHYDENATWLKAPTGGTFDVSQGLWLARIGNRAAPGSADNFHLHFSSMFDGVPPLNDDSLTNFTYPLAFSDYEVSDNLGHTWRPVKRGIPKKGQWVRRPN
jgi:murein DD-endopeptidase MepM/ murein hydrolase activator NlpD